MKVGNHKAKRWFPALFCPQHTVLLKNSHSIASVCTEIKQHFINICPLLAFRSPGVQKRQLKETDAFSHVLFTALIPQPYKRENTRVSVYFMCLLNPQIDSCKMFLIKDLWPGIKQWAIVLAWKGYDQYLCSFSSEVSEDWFHSDISMTCVELVPRND